MVTEPSSSVKYAVLVQAFNQSKKALQAARLKKKVAKEARDKGDSEDISKMERHSLFFSHKREKHRFKAKKAKLKFIREQLRLWFKLNPNETTPDMLTQVNERIKNLGNNEDGLPNASKKAKDKVKKIKKGHLLEIDKEKKVKHHKHIDDLNFIKVKLKKDSEEVKGLKTQQDKKSLTADSKVIAPKNIKPKEQPVEITERNNDEKKSFLQNPSIDKASLGANNLQTSIPDLTIIEGIGPKVLVVLNSHNILTFSDIVQISVDSLRQILKAHKLYIINPTTWAEQAQLVIENKMDELKALQLILKNGKRV